MKNFIAIHDDGPGLEQQDIAPANDGLMQNATGLGLVLQSMIQAHAHDQKTGVLTLFSHGALGCNLRNPSSLRDLTVFIMGEFI